MPPVFSRFLYPRRRGLAARQRRVRDLTLRFCRNPRVNNTKQFAATSSPLLKFKTKSARWKIIGTWPCRLDCRATISSSCVVAFANQINSFSPLKIGGGVKSNKLDASPRRRSRGHLPLRFCLSSSPASCCFQMFPASRWPSGRDLSSHHWKPNVFVSGRQGGVPP